MGKTTLQMELTYSNYANHRPSKQNHLSHNSEIRHHIQTNGRNRRRRRRTTPNTPQPIRHNTSDHQHKRTQRSRFGKLQTQKPNSRNAQRILSSIPRPAPISTTKSYERNVEKGKRHRIEEPQSTRPQDNTDEEP